VIASRLFGISQEKQAKAAARKPLTGTIKANISKQHNVQTTAVTVLSQSRLQAILLPNPATLHADLVF
jgi:hypothetical protein